MQIREATYEDISFVADVGRRFHENCIWKRYTIFDPAGFRCFIAKTIDSDNGVILIHDYGAICGAVYEQFFDPATLVAQELFWWADRGGKALLAAFEKWSEERGADVIAMTCLEGMRPKAVGALYERQGYMASEHGYLRRL